MLTFDPVTRAELKSATSQQDWATKLNAALGVTRRVIGIRNGTVFRNVGSVGPITVVGGTITKLGKIKGTTVSLAADMSTGESFIRIEGNNRWMQGSLGLSQEAQVASGVALSSIKSYDFAVGRNFTETNGFGITANFSVSAYKFLQTGVGPATSQYDKNAPASFEVWNWVDEASPFLVGTIKLNKRADDFIFEDEELARSNGDVAVYQSTESVMHGVHEFGASLFVSHESNTEVGNIPLYQVLVSCAHRGTWTSYPASTNYDFKNHSVHPLPFKIIMRDGNGNILHTFEMRDALPINSKQLNQENYNTEKALRPKWNCAMMLPWWNTKPRVADKAYKYYRGIHADDRRQSMAMTHYTLISVEPLYTGGYGNNSKNGLANVLAAPKWAQKFGRYEPTVKNPFIPNDSEFNRSGGSAQNGPWMMGWGYEPASVGCHNWYTAPGGPRNDRSVIPTVLALWMTDPTGARLQENAPFRDMADAWLLNYFNHSNHWVKDPRTLEVASDNKEFIDGKWYFKGYYYENGSDKTGPRNIQINASQRGGTGPEHYDAFGDMPYSGWGRDPLHSYCNAGWGALLMNSPMHAIASKFDMITQTMMSGSPESNPRSTYMVRTQAWNWFQHVIAWKLASKHKLGFTRAEIEDRFSRLLLKIYEDIYLPTYVNNEDSVFCHSLRELGTPMEWDKSSYGTPGGGLGFYMAHVLQLMKQTGMWSAMMAKGGHCKIALEMQVKHMDKYCFDIILDSNYSTGSYQRYPDSEPRPTSWADWSARFENHNGGTMEVDSTGGFIPGIDVGCWPQSMWPFIRRDYFPEIPHPRLNDAIAKYDAYAAARKGYVNSVTAPRDQSNRDYTYKYPSVCRILPPAPGDLGPA
jgi:hypothetical protein